MKENIKENKKTNTKAQNDLSLLFKYRKFLMGFAALWILMTHEWQIVTNETSFFFVTENFIKRIGFCGVDIFLLLSGMGLYYSLEKNPVSRFYYNRLKRVIFPFIIMASIVSQIDHWTNEFYFNIITGISFYKTNIYLFLWFVPAVITLYLFTPVFYNFFILFSFASMLSFRLRFLHTLKYNHCTRSHLHSSFIDLAIFPIKSVTGQISGIHHFLPLHPLWQIGKGNIPGFPVKIIACIKEIILTSIRQLCICQRDSSVRREI